LIEFAANLAVVVLFAGPYLSYRFLKEGLPLSVRTVWRWLQPATFFGLFFASLAWYGLRGPNPLLTWPIMLWSAFTLLWLRREFGESRLFLSFLFAYSLSELLFNALAFAAFAGDLRVLTFMTAPSWQLFFVAVVLSFFASWLYLRPSFHPSFLSLAGFALFCAAWAGAGLPSMPAYAAGANIPLYSVLFFEFGWQLNMFQLVALNFRRRRSG
jgi:hypothetical protein